MLTLVSLAAAFIAFVLAFVALAGLEGTCAGRCEGAGEPRCDFCPERAGDST